MKSRRLVLITLCFSLSCAWAAEVATDTQDNPEIQALEKQVKTLIEDQGNYKDAIMAYAKAARANPTETYYRTQFALLRSVFNMQNAMAKESVLEKWAGYAEAIRAYHYSKGFYKSALTVDKATHAKINNAISGARTLETLLLNKEDDTVKAQITTLLQPTDAEDTPARLTTLRPVALAHLGQTDKAMAAVENITLNPKEDAFCLFDMARIYKAADKQEDVIKMLTLFLEHTVPTEMPTSKNMITLCADFQDMKDQEAFQKMLTTESKIAQSDCTGGSSCGSCSLKGKCSSSH